MARKPRIEFPGAIYHLMGRDWGGPELRELNEQRWEEVVKAELKRRDKTWADLSNEGKSVQWKRDLAVRLRTKTSASNPWIAR